MSAADLDDDDVPRYVQGGGRVVGAQSSQPINTLRFDRPTFGGIQAAVSEIAQFLDTRSIHWSNWRTYLFGGFRLHIFAPFRAAYTYAVWKVEIRFDPRSVQSGGGCRDVDCR